MTHYVHYIEQSPTEDAMIQAARLTQKYLSQLHLLGIKRSNRLYPIYEMGLAAEIHAYLKRIGKVPHAPSEAVLAFEDDSCARVVAYLMYLPVPRDPDACGVTYMVVDEPFRNQGIARSMMDRVKARFPHIELTCFDHTVPFYERLGFRAIDVHRTQIVMNTRDHSSTEMMAIEDVDWIYKSQPMIDLQARLLHQHGPGAMRRAETQLEKHIEDLKERARVFFDGYSRAASQAQAAESKKD